MSDTTRTSLIVAGGSLFFTWPVLAWITRLSHMDARPPVGLFRGATREQEKAYRRSLDLIFVGLGLTAVGVGLVGDGAIRTAAGVVCLAVGIAAVVAGVPRLVAVLVALRRAATATRHPPTPPPG